MVGKVHLALEDGAEAIVVRSGIKVEFNANGGIDVYGNVPVVLHPSINDDGTAQSGGAPQVGDPMPDGSIFAGVSPDTGNAMYTTPGDAPLTRSFNQARNYASALDAYGRKDWRVPTRSELNVLFKNRAAIGGFNVSGAFASGWYWSSTEHPDGPASAWVERFSDGFQYWCWKDYGASVRPVRTGQLDASRWCQPGPTEQKPEPSTHDKRQISMPIGPNELVRCSTRFW